MIKATVNGIKFRFTMAIVVTPATSETAIITPATGDTVLPMEAESCIGNIIEVLFTPNWLAILGTNGPKAKKAAFPLPISMDAKKMSTVITILMPIAPKPRCWDTSIKLSINPRLIRPLAKISAAMIRVTTVLKMLPMPFQNVFIES